MDKQRDRLLNILFAAAIIGAIVLNELAISGMNASANERPEGARQNTVVSDTVTEPVVSDAEPVVSGTEPVESVAEPVAFEINAPIGYVAVGSTMALEVTPAASAEGLKWSLDDDGIASVEGGVVTGLAKGSTLVTACAPDGGLAFYRVNVVPAGKVYLSPSTQGWYKYPVGDVSEKAQCTIIAEHCKARLNKAGVECVLADPSQSLGMRASEANKQKANCYVSIQTRDDIEDKSEGARVYYNKYSHNSARMSLCVFDKLSPLINTANKGRIGSGSDSRAAIADEVEYPQKNKMPALIVEVQSHESAENAQWIIDNSQAIGDSIADGILEYYLTK